MSSFRFKCVETASSRGVVEASIPEQRPEKYFAEQVFDRGKMYEYLPLDTYHRLVEAIDKKLPLSRELADSVADGMKRWAVDSGARHYTHWFHPLTDGTAEKHDSFIETDGKGGVIEKFTGKLLVQQEPDASSFPNGGIRNTFEARGYSAWDISSPAFIVNRTLCIPTIFISYTGESLDYKTPLLRSINAVDKAGTRFCNLFDPEVRNVRSYLGIEQEYFLIDEALYSARPDLMLTGRTLMGHESAKNQQLEDHYFGAIPKRVEAFMLDLETAAHRLGIPVKTRHNEVAPNQFELAPVYEETNLANDHNLLLMSLMDDVARKHHFRVLLHEKPFDGINGSGKHCNWSLGADNGVLLTAPGKTPEENLRFLALTACVLDAVDRHGALLKASIISATNAHRLGANEAPPAIISVFLGSQISKLIEAIETHSGEAALVLDPKEKLSLNMAQIPSLLVDNTDRNRTSPLAFTGNRFEFRAVGSSANCASGMIALNAAVADSLDRFAQRTEKRISAGESLQNAVLTEIREILKSARRVHFDGNGYSEEWKEEAARRGLDTETCPPLMYDAYLLPSSVEMFTRTGVFSERELEARNEVKWEMYTKKIQIEARVLGDLAINHVLPAALRYQNLLLDNAYKISQLFSADRSAALGAADRASIEAMSAHMAAVRQGVEDMVAARKEANRIPEERTKAIAYAENVVPRMEEIRRHIDKLELMVDNETWPLPKYREMLFIK